MLRNTNDLLGVHNIDGVKTGQTARAGGCLIISASRDPVVLQEGARRPPCCKRRVIVVLLGSPDRFPEAKQLLERGEALFDAWAKAGRQLDPEDLALKGRRRKSARRSQARQDSITFRMPGNVLPARRFAFTFPLRLSAFRLPHFPLPPSALPNSAFVMTKKRIGILTSGGDCPGLNAVIRGVVRAADKLEWEVVGFIDGFEGLLQPGDYRILDRHSTAMIMPQGGTILGTTNKGHFISKVGAGDKIGVAPETVENAREILQRLRIEGLILVGGDGSLTTGQQLLRGGLPDHRRAQDHR